MRQRLVAWEIPVLIWRHINRGEKKKRFEKIFTVKLFKISNNNNNNNNIKSNTNDANQKLCANLITNLIR